MPSTVVHAGFALLLAAALVKGTLDRRLLAVVFAVVVLPEVDTVAGLWIDGAHRALLHNLALPIVAGGVVYWDTRVREDSALRGRWGPGSVRVVWIGLFALTVAHVLLDAAHLEGVNPAYPIVDRFVSLEGEVLFSTVDGFVQTFVEFEFDRGTEEAASAADAGTTQTTANTHVDNPVEPSAALEDESNEPVERIFPIADSGWQLYLVLTGLFVVVARRFQDRRDEA